MSDRDVKKIWEAVMSERDHFLYEPVPDPNKEWYSIIGLNTREARPISTSDIGKMVEYFKSLPGQGRMDDYEVVLDELRKLNNMGEVDQRVYSQKLGFDGSFSREDFTNLHKHLQIHINRSAGEEYLDREIKNER